MATSLAALAELVGGRIVGDSSLLVENAATLRDAGPSDITLVDTKEKAQRLAGSPARAVVAPLDFVPEGRAAIQVGDVHRAFTTIVCHFRPPRRVTYRGVSPVAHVSPTARIARDVEIGPGATVGDDVEIGAGSVIHQGANIMAGCKLAEGVTVFPGAVLYENTIVGPRCVIHAAAILGSHGFGYKLVEGRHVLSAQLGHVELGADVEVGAASTVDRGTYGPTVIGEGTKIDNLVQIAHNCRIGRHNLICSQVGVAGSTTTGDYVVMAGQVGVRDHVHIGSRAVLGAKAGVANDVPDGVHMLGSPAIPEREQKVQFAILSKLPELRKQIKELQRTVDELSKKSDGESPDCHAAA
jgi:UDP-3-O-[3-hydroxymyristoyl] glucosamine N-acyltransferase